MFAPSLTARLAAETAASRTIAPGRAASPIRSNRAALRALEAPVVQRASAGETVQRSVAPVEPSQTPPASGEQPLPQPAEPQPSEAPTRPAAVPQPESCPPPEGMSCPATASAPTAVTDTLIFPVNSFALTPLQRAQIDATAANVNAAPGGRVRIDGYASAEGECAANWVLSCRRAQAVADELATPSDGSPGVAAGDVFAHGESNEAGPALAPNRKATISVPTAPPPPPSTPTTPAPCALPVKLGTGRVHSPGAADFQHFDFPAISSSSASLLTAWALTHFERSRGAVSNAACESEMDGVLGGFASAAGHSAFGRFRAGTGGTEVHGNSSQLGKLALAASSFATTLAAVKADVEAQLAVQAAAGALDACALAVTPPATSFRFSSPAIAAVIGGTQGEELFATSFTGSVPTRSYTMTLRFVIDDHFGVDENDLYAPGLFPFWVLQHERSATLYNPFVNELDLSVPLSGTF